MNLSRIVDSNVRWASFEIRSTPMLLERISVMAPAVLSNSMGILTFLKNVSFIISSPHFVVVPLPDPEPAFSVYVRSIRVRNRPLFAKLLKLW